MSKETEPQGPLAKAAADFERELDRSESATGALSLVQCQENAAENFDRTRRYETANALGLAIIGLSHSIPRVPAAKT